jgi:hypothetical protein
MSINTWPPAASFLAGRKQRNKKAEAEDTEEKKESKT